MVTSIIVWPDWLGRSIYCLIYKQDLREGQRTEKEKKIYSLSTQKVFQLQLSSCTSGRTYSICSYFNQSNFLHRTHFYVQGYCSVFFMHNYWTVPECLLFRHTMITLPMTRITHIDDKLALCVYTCAISWASPMSLQT